MRMISYLFLFLVVATVAVALRPTCAYACSCLPPGTPAEERDKADAVFLGTVVAVNPSSGATMEGSDPVTVTFQTTTVWKGPVTQQVAVTTPGSSASCGVTFEPGTAYVVYASLNDGALSTTLCSRTTAVEHAADDIAMLGAGQPSVANPQPPTTLPQTSAGAPLQGLGQMELLLIALSIFAIGLRIRFSSRSPR